MEQVKKNTAVLLWEKGKGAYGVLAEHRYTTIAGTLTFFLITSLVPLLFWLALLFGKSGLSANEIFELDLFDSARDLLLYLNAHATDAATGASIFLLATTLWSSTGFFYHLRKSGEILYNYRRKKHGWKVRLSAVALTFAVLLFLAFSGGIIVGANIMTGNLPAFLKYITVYTLVLVLGFLAAWLMNAYICPYRARPAQTVVGSALTAAAWFIASVAFSVYLRFANPQKLYGALSLVIVFWLWLYWMMICFTAGVVFNSAQMQRRGLKEKKL